ncbi:MAG: carbonic anhydrase [Verrucomicrobiota bacterium]|nr:carbonic anhydrase [Verrucomicrobiota bacterium]
MKTQTSLSLPERQITHMAIFLATLSLGIAGLAHASEPATHGKSGATHTSNTPTISAEIALQRLTEGNKRFVDNTPQHIDQSADRRLEVSKGQHPMAIILTCSDSRLPPEIIFDQGLGDLFVIRNAGNVLDDHALGSMEYAIDHLNVGLLVVLGHEQCGAVKATVAGGEVPGHIRSIVESIQPAVDACKGKPGDPVDNAVLANVVRCTTLLKRIEPIINQAVASGRLKIIGARYELSTGKVEFLPESTK